MEEGRGVNVHVLINKLRSGGVGSAENKGREEVGEGGGGGEHEVNYTRDQSLVFDN